MHDIMAGPGFIQIFIHNDDQTPLAFVRDLMRHVFGKLESEAIAFTALIEAQDRAACGLTDVRPTHRRARMAG